MWCNPITGSLCNLKLGRVESHHLVGRKQYGFSVMGAASQLGHHILSLKISKGNCRTSGDWLYFWFCCSCSIVTLVKTVKAGCLAVHIWKLGKKKKQNQQFKTYVNEISFIRTKIICCYDYNSELKHSMEDRCIIDSDDLHSKVETRFKLSNWSIVIDDMLLNYLSQPEWRKLYLLLETTAIQ